MVEMKHKTRENIIIYGSLLLALLLIIYAAKTYYDNRDNSYEAFKELNEVFNNEKVVEEKIEIEEEPDLIRFIDKRPIVINYFDDILNRKINDSLLTYDKVYSWGDFEIKEIKYFKEVTDTYYSYIVAVKIKEKNADVSDLINVDESIKDYYLVDLKFYFVYENGELSVKNVEV